MFRVVIGLPASRARSAKAIALPMASAWGPTSVIWEPMWAWTPTMRSDFRPGRERASSSAVARSTPNFASRFPVEM